MHLIIAQHTDLPYRLDGMFRVPLRRRLALTAGLGAATAAFEALYVDTVRVPYTGRQASTSILPTVTELNLADSLQRFVERKVRSNLSPYLTFIG